MRIIGFVYYNIIGPIFQRLMQFQMGRTLKKRGRKDLISKVVPTYPPGCKRITISENYLETLSEQHVHVVRDNIVTVDGNKITTSTGESAEFDVLVLATGYKVQEFLGPFDGEFGRCNCFIYYSVSNTYILQLSARMVYLSKRCGEVTSLTPSTVSAPVASLISSSC